MTQSLDPLNSLMAHSGQYSMIEPDGNAWKLVVMGGPIGGRQIARFQTRDEAVAFVRAHEITNCRIRNQEDVVR